MNFKKLKHDWDELLISLNTDLALGEVIFKDLLTAYSNSARYYHNLDHIQQVLTVAKSIEAQATNFAIIELTIWFHDVIYDPQALDKEEKSAVYAEDVLTSLKIDNLITQSVKQLILKTKTHQTSLDDVDGQILLDADLSILGTSETEYQIYSRAIRQEYNFLSEAAYCQGRKKVLLSFLTQNRIYLTEYLFNRLENQARFNLQQELLDLTKIDK